MLVDNRLYPSRYYGYKLRDYHGFYVAKQPQRRKHLSFGRRIIRIFKNFINYIKIYFNIGSIHGYGYIFKLGVTYFERILWIILIAISFGFCIGIGLQSVNRYYTKSTVVGLERNYYYWNTSVPSLTVCPMQRLNNTKFEQYCRDHHINDMEKAYFYDFLEKLANSTYFNFEDIPLHPTIDATLSRLNIKPSKYMELIYNITYDNRWDPSNDERTRANDGRVTFIVRKVLTEYGICFMTNSYLTAMYSADYYIFGRMPKITYYEQVDESWPHLRGSYFDGDVSLYLLGFNHTIDSYIHSPYEVMKVDNNFGAGDLPVMYEAVTMEIIADDNFEKDATIAQRKCRFQHESNLEHFPFYTKYICQQECRINLAMQHCHCIPHFYPNRIARPKPVCDYKVLRECFPPLESHLLRLYDADEEDEEETTKCDCMQNCVDCSITLKKTIVLERTDSLMKLGSQVQINSWPRERLKRQIIFSFTDLLVSIGGTAGLFLGFSVLSAVEFFYFFTLRLIFHWLSYRI